MNIYLSFLQSKINHPISAYSFWEYYIKNGINEGGDEWEEGEVDWAEGLMYTYDQEKLNKWKTETWEKTVLDITLKHSKKPISFFLSYLYPHQVEEQAIKTIQKMGIPCVNFFCDNVREFTKAPKEFDVFDLNWVPEYKALGMYRKSGYPHIHLPMPMWVTPQNRQISTVDTNETSFIGSIDLQRWMLMEEVVQKGIKINIYGSGWKNENSSRSMNQPLGNDGMKQMFINQIPFLKRFGIAGFYRKISQRNCQINISPTLKECLRSKLNFDDYIRITKESGVTLGVNRYSTYDFPLNKPNTYSRLRDIEAPMLGACYLTEWTEGIDTIYEIGKEIEVYKTTNELLEKIGILMDDNLARKKLRQKGQEKALNQHCIKKSIEKINAKFI